MYSQMSEEVGKAMKCSKQRRRMIQGLVGGTFSSSAGLSWGGSARSVERGDIQFLHGVASGDPLADRVVLWTRVTPVASGVTQCRVRWEVALDAGCHRVVRRGVALARADADYTVKVDVDGLKPGTVYHYRFRCEGQRSPIGRTKTLPVGSVAQVRLAVFSCANYAAGYFHAYARAATLDDVDVAVHLGDYIYEVPQGGYGTQNASALGREMQPPHELLSLADYRQRYAQCRTDAGLQALHAAMPMMAVWDDHEIANDTWREGAAGHQPDTEGDFAQRRAAAVQAYGEWLPMRQPDAHQPTLIYRSFDFGSLVSLHMLDTRLVARDPAPKLQAYVDPQRGVFDVDALQRAAADPQRQLLGAAQTEWLRGRLRASNATWQVLGQQVLMGPTLAPQAVLAYLRTNGKQGLSMGQYIALRVQAQQDPASVSEAHKAWLALPAVPYNLDAWDGYGAARDEVLGLALSRQQNLVVLTGDTHNAWASNLSTSDGRAAGVQFATPSVTSPGFEGRLIDADPTQVAALMRELNAPRLPFAETQRRGFMVITATAQTCQADWHFVDRVTGPEAAWQVGPSLRTRVGDFHL